LRADGCAQFGQELLNYIERINLAQRILDADCQRGVQSTSALLQKAIEMNNVPAVGFASDLLIYLVGGGKAKDFFAQTKHAHWKDVNLSGLIEPDSVARLLEPPISLMPLLELKPAVGGTQVAEKAVAIESVSVETDVKETKDPLVFLSQTYPGVKTLFGSDELWFDSPQDDIVRTPLENVAALLAGNNWDEKRINAIKIALHQTILPKWKQGASPWVPRIDKKGVTIGVGYGTRFFYTKEQVIDLILFMHQNLGTTLRLTPLRISNEAIGRWPYDAKKNFTGSLSRRYS